MRLPYICLNRKQNQMFKHVVLISIYFLSNAAFGQNFQPGHHCRASKQAGNFNALSLANQADSIHIQRYDIRIDSLSFSQQSLWGVTTLTVESKVDQLSEVNLSLDGFTIDSVLRNGNLISHTYDGLNLKILLPSSINTGETDTVSVIYHGNPAQDPSGWGGYYWNGSNYAFNMGVGFEEDPHVFGRAWFPCLDVFTDRAAYDFHIKVSGDYKGFCNGELISVEDHGNGLSTYHWQMDEPIPTYLASMAVAEYHFLERTYSGIPTIWAALPQDTLNVLSTFQHMQEAVDAFVSAYGPYQWDKIGYALVPFNAGAMEHASSIHIGKPFVNGSLTYETLWAHELAHMWWGDLVTCENQENMWLNEGFAAYSEALFTGAVYGDEAYKNWIRENHRAVLQFAHVTDGDYYAMDEIPHSVTYGSTVYEKGPDVVHTLRHHMGDSLFFMSCKAYMDSLAFGNGNSYDLRDEFSEASGLNLNAFFDGWVFEAGFPHFSIDSFSVMPIPDVFQVEIFIRQKQRGNTHIYEMPIQVNLANADSSMNVWLNVTGQTQSFIVHPAFEPTMITIDRWEKMSDAISDFEHVITTIGTYAFNQTNVEIEVMNAGLNTSIIRIEDHFVQPDGFIGENPGIYLNPYHYWSVDGLLANGFHSTAEFEYNGSANNSQGYMDNDLILTEDSLVFMYRLGAGYEWQEVDGYEVVTGASLTNKRGSVVIDTLKKGEYVLARRDFTASITSFETRVKSLFAYPNPTDEKVIFELPAGRWNAQLIDLRGRIVMEKLVSNGFELDVSITKAGNYVLRLRNETQLLSQKLIIK